MKHPKPTAVPFPSRDVKRVTCPCCWTDQRTERDFCYRCGVTFRYLDEEKPTEKAG